MTNIPEFNTKELLFKHLRDNKSMLIISKKSELKHADIFSCVLKSEENVTGKSNSDTSLLELDKMNISVAINTTNLMDSHNDVHIPNLWNKSLKEQKNLYLLKEHKMSFESIISDNVKASAKTMSWAELGYSLNGNTQVLIFDAEVIKDRNTYMYDSYAKGYVKNHSVGMRYVKVEMAMNSMSPYDKEEKAVWDKYINQVANADLAEQKGYFFAVTEAKIVEGSAVPLGSNYATPTISVGKETRQLSNNIDALTTEADELTPEQKSQIASEEAKQLQETRKKQYLLKLKLK